MSRADQEPHGDQPARADRGYNCGLVVAGYNDLGGLGGGAMAWAGHCVFTATRNGGGIKVIDMSDPTDPTVVGDLPTFGSSENMHAVVTSDRAVLAYGRGIYDVSDCERPQVLGDIKYSDKPIGSPHNVKLSPDGTKMVGTMPLTITDISDLANSSTWSVHYLQCEVARQVQAQDVFSTLNKDPVNACTVVQSKDVHALVFPPPQLAHEPEFNADGTRLYIAGQKQMDWFDGDVPMVYQRQEYLHVLDMTTPTPTVISEAFGPGHGINSIKIGGHPYLLHSNEGGNPGAACKPEGSPTPGVEHSNAEAFLTDIGVETAPTTISTLRLDINTPDAEHCAAQLDANLGPTCVAASSAASRGCVSTPHYHSVDNPADATFAMLSMTSAGLRIWDIRDPEHPYEVAYWSSGQVSNTQGCVSLGVAGGQCGFAALRGTTVPDPIGAYAHYDAATGYIWVNTRVGGLWVLRLEPQVRAALGLPPIDYPNQPDSGPAKPLGGFELSTQLSGQVLATASSSPGSVTWLCSL